MVGLAPAIANAIFDAAGVRRRALPLVPNGLEARLKSSFPTFDRTALDVNGSPT
jgi:hypothetical protein